MKFQQDTTEDIPHERLYCGRDMQYLHTHTHTHKQFVPSSCKQHTRNGKSFPWYCITFERDTSVIQWNSTSNFFSFFIIIII